MEIAAGVACVAVGLIFLLVTIKIWRKFASHVMLLMGGLISGGWLALGAKILG